MQAESLTVPTAVEQNLCEGDGSAGFSLRTALQLDQNEVPNLYSFGNGEFRLQFQEHGVAYNEQEATDYVSDVCFRIDGESSGISLKVDLNAVEKWGINFAGTVACKHPSGEERIVYLPGTRTYDPAGMTGDPHASERIGPSCSRTQMGITLSELFAAQKGAELKQIGAMQEKLAPMITRYHGREFLFQWMKLQIEEAIYKNKDVTPYPEYLKEEIRAGRLVLNASREHTRAYLQAYNDGNPHPPIHYFRKVAKKDKVEEIFQAQDLEKFQKIVAE